MAYVSRRPRVSAWWPVLVAWLALALVACSKKSDSDSSGASPNSNGPNAPNAPRTGADEGPDVTGESGAEDGRAGKSGDKVRSAREVLATPEGRAWGKKLGREFRAHLAEGRRLSKAEKYAEAVAELDKALAIDPNHSRALSEVGWAALQAGDLDRAERANLDSVRFAPDNDVKGASLYNLGRIEEKRGNDERAAEYYVRSLAVRANATVEKRLDALVKRGVKVKRDVASCSFERYATREIDSAKLCMHTAAALTEEFGADNDEKATCDQRASHLGTPIARVLLFGEPALDRAMLYSVHGPEGMMDYLYLSVYSKGAWHTMDLDAAYNPGAFGIFEDLAIETFEDRELIPGGESEIVITWRKSRSDTDMGLGIIQEEEYVMTMVVGLLDGEVAPILSVQRSSRHAAERIPVDEEELSEEALELELPYESTTSTKLEFAPATGEAIIEHQDQAESELASGRYRLTTFPKRCPF